ncbi:protein ROOT PRIMORDIUM DEFECTIVE 1 isoform X2 [Momordica charantia]|uniref:Protein ROOT PRIMORDIUM DEFECTIVE 1 isoform X2 n=1 Tax=Momordica charantia TaxID=3673 RepID=A0A6J1BXE4_MOMCH|nr:protein ROOT PRIMORDIUM DEFECTIVE 1 isoform X2 [Momordica charantia]
MVLVVLQKPRYWNPGLSSSPALKYLLRNFSLWSMKKEPDLESALSRNRRWIVNNQIKNIVLQYPNQAAPVKFLQKRFKTLDLQEEAAIKDMQEPVFVERLAKLLMMASNKRLNVVKLSELRRNFGLPDDYLIRIVPKYSDMFRIVNYTGKRNSMEIELVSWKPELAISSIESSASRHGVEPAFSCSLPTTWINSWEKFHEFNASPYVSPYVNPRELVQGSKEMEKRTVGLIHEILSLTLWKKASIMKLSHFSREFGVPAKLNGLLLKHPGIFYISNKYQIYTVVLREGYKGSELIEKDPLVVAKEKFGEVMQEGLHEYNKRHHLMNIEKKRMKGMLLGRSEKKKSKDFEEKTDDGDEGNNLGGLLKPEERKRFYQCLFDDAAA